MLCAIETHPIQYHAPLYAFLAKDGRFDLRVFYMTDRGSRPYYDAFAKATVRFDNPILDGYAYEFLRTGEPEGWWSKKTELMQFRLRKRLTLLYVSQVAMTWNPWLAPSQIKLFSCAPVFTVPSASAEKLKSSS